MGCLRNKPESVRKNPNDKNEQLINLHSTRPSPGNGLAAESNPQKNNPPLLVCVPTFKIYDLL